MYRLTEKGKKECERFIAECQAKRKELLDAGKDTADETTIPSVEDIELDINIEGIDEENEYYNSWGVTDHYDSPPISLVLWDDFIIMED